MMIGSGGFLLWFVRKKKEKHKKDALKVLLLTGCLGFLICISEERNMRLTADGKLLRTQEGEDTQIQDLQLDIDGILENYHYIVELDAQRLKGKKKKQLFQDAAKEAEVQFLAGNASIDCINQQVLLQKSLQAGKISASWTFEPEGVIDEEGELWTDHVGQEGIPVTVLLKMTYYDETQMHTFGCHVYPKKRTLEEEILSELHAYMQKEQENSKNKPYLTLPESIHGNILQWSVKKENTYRIILMLGFLASAIVYVQQAIKEQQQEQRKKEQLLRQYPDMVSKLSLLLGAGMTFSGAWERIVLNYQRQMEQKQTKPVEIYEQMLLSYREMQDGVGEMHVYERFGERCNIPQYRKLAMLIVQNLRKGSSGLIQMLEKEVSEAYAWRKNNAKKAGEEAGTKILIPMMMMLCVVMIIILVPAFLSFQI